MTDKTLNEKVKDLIGRIKTSEITKSDLPLILSSLQALEDQQARIEELENENDR